MDLSVIVNPSTGPGRAVDPNYVQAINRLVDAGASLFGYIDSNYGQRSLDLMRKDVDGYLALYPRIAHGYFLDLVPSAGDSADIATYSALYTYIQSKDSALRVIGNPGVRCASLSGPPGRGYRGHVRELRSELRRLRARRLCLAL